MANHKLVFRVPPGTEGEQWLKQMGKYLNKESYSVRRKFTGARPKGTSQLSTLKENAHSIRIYITEKVDKPLAVTQPKIVVTSPPEHIPMILEDER